MSTKLRFKDEFDDGWTLVKASGEGASAAINILATALVRRGDEVQIIIDDEWSTVEESE